jgi:hypothetical protein
MPYPHEHAARIREPSQFDEFRRNKNFFAPGIDAIWGIKRRPERKVELQAIRFDASRWTVKEAKKWLKEHGYKPVLFEPATEPKKK